MYSTGPSPRLRYAVPDLSKGVHALRIVALLILLAMKGCASSVARSETPRATEGALAMDTDEDTIPDSVVTYPEVNGDRDGCPEQRRDLLGRSPALQIWRRTYFAPGADIQPREVAFLDALAKVLTKNPDILALRLEGQTDGRGDAERNLEVSRQRAEAVRSYLIARGVAPVRLTLRAPGDSKPHCDKPTGYARASPGSRDAYNRRIEYRIVRRLPDEGTDFKQHP